MSGLQELNRWNIAEPQSEQNALPNTIASADRIVPTHKFTRITGTTVITKITPPEPGYHVLTLVFTSAYANALTSGGAVDGAIAVTYTSVADRPISLHYDPRTQLYYPAAVV